MGGGGDGIGRGRKEKCRISMNHIYKRINFKVVFRNFLCAQTRNAQIEKVARTWQAHNVLHYNKQIPTIDKYTKTRYLSNIWYIGIRGGDTHTVFQADSG